MSTDNIRYCTRCQRKRPPVQTPLVIGENISARNMERGRYWCIDCNRDYNDRRQRGELYDTQQHRDEVRQQKVDELTQFWEDPILVKEFPHPAKRLIELMRKNRVRSPERGYTWDVIGEVVFNDLWYFDVDEDIADYLKQKGLRGYDRHNVKGHISAYVGTLSEVIREGQHVTVEYKVKGLENSANNIYNGQEKIVASPPYEDEYGNCENRHFLMSDYDTQNKRAAKKRALQEQLDNSIRNELNVVDNVIAEEKIAQEKQEDRDSDQERGGE